MCWKHQRAPSTLSTSTSQVESQRRSLLRASLSHLLQRSPSAHRKWKLCTVCSADIVFTLQRSPPACRQWRTGIIVMVINQVRPLQRYPPALRRCRRGPSGGARGSECFSALHRRTTGGGKEPLI